MSLQSHFGADDRFRMDARFLESESEEEEEGEFLYSFCFSVDNQAILILLEECHWFPQMALFGSS